MAGRVARPGRARRGVRALRGRAVSRGARGREPVVQLRPVRRARVLPCQRLRGAGFAGTPRQRRRVLDQPGLPPVSPVVRRRGGRDGVRRRGRVRDAAEPAGRQSGHLHPGAPDDAAGPPSGGQRRQRVLDVVVRNGLLPARDGDVRGGRAPCRHHGHDRLRRRGRHRGRTASGGRAVEGRRHRPGRGRHGGRVARGGRVAGVSRAAAPVRHRGRGRAGSRAARRQQPDRGVAEPRHPRDDVRRHRALPARPGAAALEEERVGAGVRPGRVHRRRVGVRPRLGHARRPGAGVHLGLVHGRRRGLGHLPGRPSSAAPADAPRPRGARPDQLLRLSAASPRRAGAPAADDGPGPLLPRRTPGHGRPAARGGARLLRADLPRRRAPGPVPGPSPVPLGGLPYAYGGGLGRGPGATARAGPAASPDAPSRPRARACARPAGPPAAAR